ncbi:MAG: NAD(P)-dependent oxidoreductase [Anaerolineae bacterium]|nr:NAD(P)-dependent oxidoreductase [Anaerolineae bacterium]
MHIAVTGASGEMGRALVPYLIEQGHSVRSIDRTLPAGLWGSPKLNYWAADTRDYGEFVGSLQGCDALVHLAAIRAPTNHPDAVVYNDNTTSSYNALSAAAVRGIKRVCLASSVNAIGGAFSRVPRYDYFPLDENHPTYSEDPYSLSKWVLEQQGAAFARRFEDMVIASLRFHWLVESRDRARERTLYMGEAAIKHLWAYTLLGEAARACLLSLTADFKGHEVFYIVAPRTVSSEPTLSLVRQYYPNTELRREFPDNAGLFDCGKAERILRWRHLDPRSQV